jgi:hypothetical protein
MKTSINKDGILTIKSENEIESYALNKWLKDNYRNPKESDLDEYVIDAKSVFFNAGLFIGDIEIVSR